MALLLDRRLEHERARFLLHQMAGLGALHSLLRGLTGLAELSLQGEGAGADRVGRDLHLIELRVPSTDVEDPFRAGECLALPARREVDLGEGERGAGSHAEAVERFRQMHRLLRRCSRLGEFARLEMVAGQSGTGVGLLDGIVMG
jgi:hypothetical protein